MKHTLAVVDTETTGLERGPAELTEIGAHLVEIDIDERAARLLGVEFHTMVDPQHPIPPEISAITHIVDEDVKGAPTPDEARQMFLDWANKHNVQGFVAHNAPFDSSFLELTLPWICTHRLAQHLWPDAPRFSNQTLRYWRGLDVPRDLPVHRATSDAYVTAELFCELYKNAAQRTPKPVTIETLIRGTNKPAILQKMPFGKHKGELFSELPRDYLWWIIGSDIDDECVIASAKDELSKR